MIHVLSRWLPQAKISIFLFLQLNKNPKRGSIEQVALDPNRGVSVMIDLYGRNINKKTCCREWTGDKKFRKGETRACFKNGMPVIALA